jgi:peptidoglycan/xylan/chitin deacetylase (PgdA/CDA1 family)
MIIRIGKLIISFFYLQFLFFNKLFCKFLNIECPGKCITIYYHSIKGLHKSRFSKQLDILLKWTTPVPSNYSGFLERNKNYSVITFDDGFISLYNNAIPELTRRNIPFTIFFPTNFLGEKPAWDIEEKNKDDEEYVMDKNKILEINPDLVTIGSHSVNHPDFNHISPEEALYEFRESKKYLEYLIKRDVTTFSFPYGKYNKELVSQALGAGYKRLFTIDPDYSLKTPNEQVTGRIWTDPSDWKLEYWLKINGAYCWQIHVQRLKNNFNKINLKKNNA